MKRWEIALAEEAADRPSQGPRLSALDVRGEHRVLANFSEAELAALQLLPEGTPLRRYQLYLDLHDPARADFAAEGSERVKPGQRLVARETTDPEVWDALRRGGPRAPGRGGAGETGAARMEDTNRPGRNHEDYR